MGNTIHTLCWDCKKACGGCSWSDHGEHTPVPGWKAIETTLRIGKDMFCTSYIVMECPEFERDGNGGGARRLEWGKRDPWSAAAMRRKQNG